MLGTDAPTLMPEHGKPDGASASSAAGAQLLPSSIGRYRILRLLGEGGMGAVYEAEQDQPRRLVALKVIRAAWASPDLLRRFEQESQALGRLHHPGIAQIYEAGSAETGFGVQPFFAMELIHGKSLVEYADEHKLNTRQRLELIIQVCDAVQHAHQRGIIHRDLKPANILVDDTGQPKILDFGLARATDSDAQATRQTDMGQLLGTLAYMSPEQVLADPLALDTRTDVYALGVILYELLAGKMPYMLPNLLHEAVRTIQQTDPAPLSSIDRTYRGDIETIVSKALEKDKARRYASAAEMAADIRHHLHDEPIVARPASTAYQLKKFARRNKPLVSGIAGVFVVLMMGVVASTWEAVQARRAEKKAQQQSAIAQAVNDFLQNDLLGQASSFNQAKGDPNITVRAALDCAASEVETRFANYPEVKAAILYTIGDTYNDLGRFADGEKELQKALTLQQRLFGPDDPKTLATMEDLAWANLGQGKLSEAEALFQNTCSSDLRVFGNKSRTTLHCMYGLAGALYQDRKFAQAEALYQQTLDLERRNLGRDDPQTLRTMTFLADTFAADGKNDRAEELARDAMTAQREVLGATHPDTVESESALNLAYYNEGKYNEAGAAARDLLQIEERVLGPDHPKSLWLAGMMVAAFDNSGKSFQAEPLARDTFERRQRVVGLTNRDTLQSLANLGDVLFHEGKNAQALPLYMQALQMRRRAFGENDADVISSLTQLAEFYQAQHNYNLAEKYDVEATTIASRVLGTDSATTAYVEAGLGSIYLDEGKYDKAESVSRQALSADTKTQPDNWQRYLAETLLGESLARQKKPAAAEPLLRDGYQGMLARKDRIDVPHQYYLQRAHQWLLQLDHSEGKTSQRAQR